MNLIIEYSICKNNLKVLFIMLCDLKITFFLSLFIKSYIIFIFYYFIIIIITNNIFHINICFEFSN